jgi:hypothetical protein
VQKRGIVGAGGLRDIPPARTQYFSNSEVFLAFREEMKPFITAIMRLISESLRLWERVVGMGTSGVVDREASDQPIFVEGGPRGMLNLNITVSLCCLAFLKQCFEEVLTGTFG